MGKGPGGAPHGDSPHVSRPHSLAAIFGTKHERDIKAIQPLVFAVNEWERKLAGLSDEDLRAKTPDFKQRLEAMQERELSLQEALTDLLPEAFAVVREAALRTLGMRHFDVQLMGGMVLHEGKIAEMKTGEGKTLVATLPVYLNALAGKGVHVVTVNDYLARRDAEWMGQVYKFLGLTVGCIQHDMDNEERQARLRLRRHLRHQQRVRLRLPARQHEVPTSEAMVQRGHYYAIVDEVDSILIDEARTPLIISGPARGAHGQATTASSTSVVPSLKKEEDYDGGREAALQRHPHRGGRGAGSRSSSGVDNLYDPANTRDPPLLTRPCGPTSSTSKDVDYVVKDGEVLIVDEFTGRLMPGRRWSDGLHQAIEAKEGVRIQQREPDPGHHHLPELLPHVREAGRHDRHRRHRGGRVPQDLQAGRGGDPHQPAHGPRRTPTTSSTRPRRRSSTRSSRRSSQLHEKGQPVLVGTVSIEKSRAPLRRCSSARASRTRCSTPSTTRRKRRSSPRRASPAP